MIVTGVVVRDPYRWMEDLDASRGRVTAIDIRQPQRANGNEIIPQSAGSLKAVRACILGAMLDAAARDPVSQHSSGDV
jgi:hypothetical protein